MQSELFNENKPVTPAPMGSALQGDARGAYENMTPIARQAVLDKLGGFPYRAYTPAEWLTAYRETL